MAVIGSPPGAFPQLTITQSQTWVPPQDGTVCIHVVGAGGGGAGWYASSAAGGAGAYFKIPSLAVTTSGSFTLVVGVGGGGGFPGSGSGITGGASTVAGTGLTGTKTAGGGILGNLDDTNGAGGQFSGSGESVVGYTGGAGGGEIGAGGAVGVHATGQAGGWNTVESGQAWKSSIRSSAGGVSDAASGGLAMSGFGIICGGSQSGDTVYIQGSLNGPASAGLRADDLCGGGGVYTGGLNQYCVGGAGGIGGGGGVGWNEYNNASYRVGAGGRGGDGIILIQYLPW